VFGNLNPHLNYQTTTQRVKSWKDKLKKKKKKKKKKEEEEEEEEERRKPTG
jgi:hypothetical protein